MKTERSDFGKTKVLSPTESNEKIEQVIYFKYKNIVMPWTRGVDQRADPNKQYERFDSPKGFNVRTGRGRKKTKGANPGRRCGRLPTGRAERGAGWSWVRR